MKQAGGVAADGLPVSGVPAQAPPAPALGVDPCEAVHAQAEPAPVQAQELVLVTGGAGAWWNGMRRLAAACHRMCGIPVICLLPHC